MRLITLTTDFGSHDWFVGTMKGVIAQRAPHSQVVDVTHGISAGDVWGGAFALASAAPFFPKGTVHVVVVDPGVGSTRPAIVARTDTADYVGPDNGVLSLALRRAKRISIHRIENRSLCLDSVSQTFHGRDVFAPVAAYLARGGPLKSVGSQTREITQLACPEPELCGRLWRGQVIYLDRFGNGITNLPASLVDSSPRITRWLRVGRKRVPVRDCYSAVSRGQPVAVVGSTNLLEVAVNGGSAAQLLHLRLATPVELA